MIEWSKIIKHSELIATRDEVNQTIKQLAQAITEEYHDKNPIVLSVMNGGLFFTAKLCEHLAFPLRLDYVHATRYRGTTADNTLQWVKTPRFHLANEHVLLLDDIFDEGVTLQEISTVLQQQHPASLEAAVLVDKQHQRKPKDFSVGFRGMHLQDRYLFGCGMDYFGHWRHLPQIYAVNHQKEAV